MVVIQNAFFLLFSVATHFSSFFWFFTTARYQFIPDSYFCGAFSLVTVLTENGVAITHFGSISGYYKPRTHTWNVSPRKIILHWIIFLLSSGPFSQPPLGLPKYFGGKKGTFQSGIKAKRWMAANFEGVTSKSHRSQQVQNMPFFGGLNYNCHLQGFCVERNNCMVLKMGSP